MATPGSGKTIEWIRYHANYDADFCLIWPFCRNPNGYGTFGYLGKPHYAHRFMCEFVNGPAPTDEHEAAHSCGNGNMGCVNPRHLSWKTKSENRIDALNHGTGVRGRNGRKRLNESQVAEIRSLQGKMTQAEIAAKFGISEPNVRAILTWRIYNGNSKLQFWTAEEDQRLRDLLARGMNLNQVSEVMGRRVHSRAYRIGLKSGWPVGWAKKDKSAGRNT